MTREVVSVPSGRFAAGITTFAPGASLADVATISVTGTLGGTVIVWDPPLYATVIVRPAPPDVPFFMLAAPFVIVPDPLVMLADPLVIVAEPFVIRESETLPFVIEPPLAADGGAIGRLPSPSPRSSSGKT
jgi:hypothetical protein